MTGGCQTRGDSTSIRERHRALLSFQGEKIIEEKIKYRKKHEKRWKIFYFHATPFKSLNRDLWNIVTAVSGKLSGGKFKLSRMSMNVPHTHTSHVSHLFVVSPSELNDTFLTFTINQHYWAVTVRCQDLWCHEHTFYSFWSTASRKNEILLRDVVWPSDGYSNLEWVHIHVIVVGQIYSLFYFESVKINMRDRCMALDDMYMMITDDCIYAGKYFWRTTYWLNHYWNKEIVISGEGPLKFAGFKTQEPHTD